MQPLGHAKLNLHNENTEKRKVGKAGRQKFYTEDSDMTK
jgi:hypothetical protein